MCRGVFTFGELSATISFSRGWLTLALVCYVTVNSVVVSCAGVAMIWFGKPSVI